jgi:putrescine transport system substrate-binding protein
MNPSMMFAVFAAALALCSCSRHKEQSTGFPAVPDSAALSLHDNEQILNVYSWANYIAPNTIVNFEKETGIKVHYDVFDSNEVLETKLLTGHSNYDVVVSSDIFFGQELIAGVYRKLDKEALPNLANADPEIMRRMAVQDPGNLHAIPYMWTTTGIGYNVDMLRARLGPNIPDSWALLFDPRNAEKLKDCGILIIDSPLDVFGSAMIYLGRDFNRHDPRDILAAAETLKTIRPFVRNIDAASIAALANGDVCLALAWSGDVEAARSRAIEASSGARIAYLLPREGAMISVDMVGIPADAPHPYNAEIWMNYLLRPNVIAEISNYIKYPNGNAASLPFIDASVKSDPAVYPDLEARARLVTNSPGSLNYSRLMTHAWTRFRAGQ